MERYQEHLSVGMYDGTLIEGTALLCNKSRLSELFNDNTARFIVLDEATDDAGGKKERVYINKDLIIWAAPRDVIHSSQNPLLSATEYVEVLIKTIKNVVIQGRINLQVFDNIFDMLRYTGTDPFLVLINARDTNGELHHTLFVNKSSIMQVESGAS